MFRLPFRTLLGFAVLVLPMSAQADLVVNGTFDVFVPINGTGGGWTNINTDGGGGFRGTGGNPGGFYILNDSGSPATDPTFSQTISGLTPGAAYNLTGDYSEIYALGSTDAVQAFGASIDGVFVFESPGLTDRLFHSFNVNFVAPAGSVTLALAAERNGTDSDFAVDNISLNAVSAPATPEPGAYALVLAGGLSGTVLLRRRKARRNTT
jgi:hypothetical protein